MNLLDQHGTEVFVVEFGSRPDVSRSPQFAWTSCAIDANLRRNSRGLGNRDRGEGTGFAASRRLAPWTLIF